MLRDATEISNAIDLIYEVCEEIRDKDGCSECPIRHICVDAPETSFMDVIESNHARMWDEFIDYADDVEFPKSELDAQYADFRRKLEIEERMLDE